jgi:Tfp pilus assembly protein PilX
MKTTLRQEGMTLLMALIMLVVLTLLALTSFNLGKSNMQVVSNMQQRDEAIAAAREVIEETISRRFFVAPGNVLLNPCNGTANTRCIDMNGDGKNDVTVVLTPPPACVKAQAIKNSALDLELPEDIECSVGQTQGMGGVAGATTGNSLCANSVWEVNAVATDNVTQASVQVTQGIAVRVSDADISTNCP